MTNPYELDAHQWRRIVQPEPPVQERIDALVAEHLPHYGQAVSRWAEQEGRRAWIVGGLLYNNLRAVRELWALGVW